MLPHYERGYAEVQAQRETSKCTSRMENTSPNAKKGNFSQRQAKRSALETDKRMAQILFNTWGIENAVQKIADLMRQDRRRMQNITKIAEEDLAKAKEKMTEWLKEKEKEKPAVNKRKREESKPKRQSRTSLRKELN